MIAIITAIAALGFCSAYGIIMASGLWLLNRRSRAQQRLNEYLAQGAVNSAARQQTGGGAPNLRHLALRCGRLFAPRRYIKMMEKKISQANLLLRPEEFIGLHMLVIAACLGLGLLVGGVLLPVVGLGAGIFLPFFFLEHLKQKRSLRFNQQIGEALVLMANSLKAGYGLLQAMETVAMEMNAPISQEFARVLKEINLGVGMEEALHKMGQRVKSDDWDLVLIAVLIQRQVGGNLAEIMENIAYTIRERIQLKREIKTLTAQGRLSGIIISFLPLALAAFLFFTNPSYILILFRHPLGLLLLGGAVVAQIIGIILIRKIVAIEV